MPLFFLNESGQELDLSSFNILYDIVLVKLHKKKRPKVTVVICDDTEMIRLNSQYRGLEQTTDVLSFTYQDTGFLGDQDLLGEIIISLEQIQRQALHFKVTIESELNKIFVHGLLHLFGYDHVLEKDFLIMKKIEDTVLSAYKDSYNIEH